MCAIVDQLAELLMYTSANVTVSEISVLPSQTLTDLALASENVTVVDVSGRRSPVRPCA